MANMNVKDPSVQEKIRRGTHKYVPGDGRHGSYVSDIYHHQEYPKVMDQTPAPQAKQFKGKPDAAILFDDARREWEELQTASIVNNKQQEEAWLEEHKDDKVVSIVDRQYPKTMDRTPAPHPDQYDDLTAFREAKEEWKKQIAASIVHDRDEEKLWLRENASPKRKKKAS
jgi:hypothetical protein